MSQIRCADPMKTPPKVVRFHANTSTQESPRHRGDRPTMDPWIDKSLHWIPTYVNPHQEGVPEVQLPKNAKYPMPMSPMSEDVIKEGDLLANIP